jgi:putative polyketide hydroxylase
MRSTLTGCAGASRSWSYTASSTRRRVSSDVCARSRCSYEAERRPIAAHNVARSADPNGSTRETADELHVDLGGRIPHVWVRSAEGRVSTLDLLSPGLTLLTGPDSVPSEAQAGGGPPVAVRRLDAVSARAIGIRGRGALLVRPDGTPARLWTHEATVAA